MILMIAHGILKLDEAIKSKIWCHYFERMPIFSGYDEKVGAYKLEDYVPDSPTDAIKHTRLAYRESKACKRREKAEKRLEALYEIEYKISYANVFQGVLNLFDGISWENPIIKRGDPRPTALIDTILAIPSVLIASPFLGFELLLKVKNARRYAIQLERGVKKEKKAIEIFEQAINTSKAIKITQQNNETVVILESQDTTYRICFDLVPVDDIEKVASFECPIVHDVDKDGKSTPYKYTMNLVYDILNSGNSEYFTDCVNAKIATISSKGGFKHVWDKITQASLVGIARSTIRTRM